MKGCSAPRAARKKDSNSPHGTKNEGASWLTEKIPKKEGPLLDSNEGGKNGKEKVRGGEQKGDRESLKGEK